MFKISGNTIHCSRGDKGIITLRMPIIDKNSYIKYKDEGNKYYWFDEKNQILYDENYKENTEISIDTLSIVYYEFEENDKISIIVYNKKGYGENPLMTKETVVAKSSNSVDIVLTEEDTTFGEVANKAIVYWYDITLNDNQTIVCFDENGAKEFIQYPAKGADE